MSTATKKNAGRTGSLQLLPLPDFYAESARRVEELWMVPYEERMAQALAFRKQHEIANAATDRFKIALVGIDNQITFITPGAQLVVGGAIGDSLRFSEFLYRNMRYITRTFMTLDTHTLWQIFHSIFLVDDSGAHPTPGVPIADEDIQAGKWKVNPEAAFAVFGNANKYAELLQHLPHYSRALKAAGDQYPLIPWPIHSMLGGICHALVPLIEEACFFHSVARGTQVQFEVKGGNPLSEAYSPYGEEVQQDHRGRPIGQKNTRMFEKLEQYDAVIVAGQAKSHCVRAFINDHLRFVLAKDPALARKVYLVEDLTSPVVIPGVVDFTEEANEAFARFRDAGMNLVTSTTPLNEWPGLEDKFN